MNELEAYLIPARKLALGIVFGQVGIVLLIAAAGWLLGGPRAFISALVGGGIGVVASFYIVVSTFRLDASAEPVKFSGGFTERSSTSL